MVHCVACFGVIFNCFHLLFVFYDIGSDGKVTLWERVARSVYNMSRLYKDDVHNCRLYVTIEIDTRVCVQVVRMIRITEGSFDKSPMKRPDIFEAMKSINFMLAPSTPGIRSA